MEEILVPRRRPTQQRSRERFARILASARIVLVDVGFESFTFDHVAHEAHVPIGTLYQFFANKYALICELDREDAARIIETLRSYLRHDPEQQWPEFLDAFIDHLALLWAEDPSRRAVWHAVQSTPATRATAAATEAGIVRLLAEVIQPLDPTLDETERYALASFVFHAVTSMLNYAVRDSTNDAATATASLPEPMAAVVQETKTMLLAYLFAVAN